MSDIIQRAKKLFENRYHDEPWLALFDSSQKRFWIETDNFAEVCGGFVSEDDTRLAAAAPELAQALAEETWEYAVQANVGGKWEYKQDGFFRDAWFSELRKAKAGARELCSIGKETRIVRRRVSQPEEVKP